MRLGELVNSGLAQPSAADASQKRRKTITAAVPRRKFSLRFQRDEAGAAVSSRASTRLSSAGVTVISACHGHGRRFFLDQTPDVIVELAEARLEFHLERAPFGQIDVDQRFYAGGTR